MFPNQNRVAVLVFIFLTHRLDQYYGQYFEASYHTMNIAVINTGQNGVNLNMEQKIRRDRNMGSNLRRLRLEHGFSQEKLCVELQRLDCDIGRTTYAKYELGELNIRASVLIALVKIYQCTYDDFFWGLDDTTSL